MGNSQTPGKINAGIRQYIHEQFQRTLKNTSKNYLTISEILQAHSHEDYPFDFRHLGILFVCDHDRDGLFSLQNIQHFAAWIQINLPYVQIYEFKSQLQAKTVAKKKDGEQIMVAWFLRMLVGQGLSKSISGGTYIRIECIKLIYEVLNVKMMSDMDIQSYFMLMKKASEELGSPIQELKENQEDQQYQEYIQIGVCKEFISHFLKGALKILSEIGYSSSL